MPDIFWITVFLLYVCYIIAILLSIKSAPELNDNNEFTDENGNHIYYDRKLIAQQRKTKLQLSNKPSTP